MNDFTRFFTRLIKHLGVTYTKNIKTVEREILLQALQFFLQDLKLL